MDSSINESYRQVKTVQYPYGNRLSVELETSYDKVKVSSITESPTEEEEIEKLHRNMRIEMSRNRSCENTKQNIVVGSSSLIFVAP